MALEPSNSGRKNLCGLSWEKGFEITGEVMLGVGDLTREGVGDGITGWEEEDGAGLTVDCWRFWNCC